MRFGFVTDELSQDPREAIETALAWDVHDFEIRNVRGVRFPRHTDDTLDLLVRLCEEYDLRYTAVSPGFFKCDLTDEAHIAYALGEGLERTLEFMAQCRIPLLICFGFEKAVGTDDQAVDLLRRLAEQLDGCGFRGAIENETHCRFDGPDRMLDLVRRVNHPAMGLNFDAANLKQGAADAYPEAYETVKPYIFNIHAKDVAVHADGTTEWCPIGEGVVDWPDMMKAIVRDKVVDHVTIENHCGPPVEVGRRNLDALRSYLPQP